jgi:hypothetical protein
MAKLIERVARLKRGGRSRIHEIIITGGPYDIGPDDIAGFGEQTWRREPGEAVETFKARVFTEIGAGTGLLIWGELPDDN